MANIGALSVTIGADTSGLDAGIARAQRTVQNFSQTAVRGAGGFARIARESQAAVPPISNLTGMLSTLTGFLGAREVIQYADAWQSAANQLRQVTDSSAELANTQSTLMDVANDTRSEFTSTANLYARLARSTTELGLSQQDLIGLTRTINQSFATSGATAEEAAGAITQLSQGLAAGALRGDEFNSVAEQAPGIMRAIAESLDMTIGELREFAAEGGITAEIVVEALQGASDTIENDFGRSVATFGQNMAVARNNLREWIGTSGTVASALDNLGTSLIAVSENMGAVVQAGGVLVSLIAGRMLGRLVALSAGLTTAAAAATALRTALAFLGGPAGIAVAAAGAIFTFREELGLVGPEAKTVAEELDEVSKSIDGMTDSMLDMQVASFGAELLQMNIRAQELRTELESLQAAASDPRAGAGPALRARMGSSDAERELAGIESRREAINQAMSGLDQFRTASDEAASGADRLGESTDNAASALDKFSASLTPEIEGILERAGRGTTIDEEGRVRDAFGNFNRVAQRELEGALLDQRNEFTNERNLQAGLDSLLARMTGAPEASGGIMATGSQSSIPGLATGQAANEAMSEAKNIGTLTFKLQGDGQDGETDVTGDARDLERLANLFSSVASGA